MDSLKALRLVRWSSWVLWIGTLFLLVVLFVPSAFAIGVVNGTSNTTYVNTVAGFNFGSYGTYGPGVSAGTACGNAFAQAGSGGSIYTYNFTGAATQSSNDPNLLCQGQRTPKEGLGCPIGGPCNPENINLQASAFCPAGAQGGRQWLNGGWICAMPEVTTSCPANSVQHPDIAERCMCNLNFRPNVSPGGTSCVPYNCQPLGLGPSVLGPFTSIESAKANFNANGTRFECPTNPDLTLTPEYGCTIGMQVSMYSQGQDGWYASVDEARLPQACQGTGSSVADSATNPLGTSLNDGVGPSNPTTCEPGQYPGTVNGASVCIDGTNTQGSSDTKVTKNPDGTTTNTTTTASCLAGSCSVTTTTTTEDAAGNEIEETTEQAVTSLAQFCASHPGSAYCGAQDSDGDGECEGDDCGNNGSTWAGSCAASFTCGGDAVQCAIAKDQHLRHCQLFEIDPADRVVGDTAIADGNDNTKEAGWARGAASEVDIGARFTSALGVNPFGSSCPGDVVIAGVTIELSAACPALQLMGYALVAFTWLAGLTWLVSKGAS